MATTQHTDIYGKPYNRWLLFTFMLLATLDGSLMQSTLGTALPTLMDKFDIDLNTAQQATTWFLLANAVMVPVSAFLIKRFPTKKLTIITYLILIAGIAMTAFTPEKHDMWELFVAGRVIAAAAVGILLPLLQITIVNIFSDEERGPAMGLMGLVVGMSPAIGPTLTGWILDRNHVILGLTLSKSWRTIFFIPLIVIAIVLLFTPWVMHDILQTNQKDKIDIPSVILSSLGFGSFLLGFTNLSADGWGDLTHVLGPIVLGIALIILFAVRQFKLDKPFLDLAVFKSWNFSVSTFLIIFVTMAMMGIEMMLPTYLQNVHGMSALDSGLTLLPGALFLGLISPIAGFLYNKAGLKRLAVAGFIVLGAGTIPFAFLTTATPSAIITLMYTVRMIGVALVLMPLTTAAMDALPLNKTTDGTAVNNTVRQLASSVGVALLTSITQNIINNHKPSAGLKISNPLEYIDKSLNASMLGFRTAFAVGLAFALVGLIATALYKTKQNNAKEAQQ